MNRYFQNCLSKQIKKTCQWAELLICERVFKYSSLFTILLKSITTRWNKVHLFIIFKIREKEQAKWAKWARILEIPLTDEQLCSLTCFFLFACLNKYETTYSFIVFEIRKNWAELSELNELKCRKNRKKFHLNFS